MAMDLKSFLLGGNRYGRYSGIFKKIKRRD